MLKILKSKSFSRYLPLALSIILVMLGAAFYFTAQKSKPAEAAWYSSSWTYRKPITIDHTKLSTTATSTFSSFPLLISVTDSQLKTVTNGGLVASSTGADILFTDKDGTTLLNYEIDNYASTTGQLVAWARIPTLSAASDYTIYEYFGNASAPAETSGNITGTWDSNYVGVWHLPNGTKLTANNTITGVAATITGATATSGQVDGGAIFGAVSTDNITTDITAHNSQRTYSIWSYRTGDGGGGLGRMFDKTIAAGSTMEQLLNSNAGVYQFARGFSTTAGSWTITQPSANAWHYIVVTYDSSSSSNAPLMYVDGVSQTVSVSGTPSGTASTNAQAYVIGNRGSDSARVWAGSLDEFRISNTLRSSDWIATEYNNQNSPSTFYAYGALGINGRQNSAGAAVPAVKIRGGVKFH